MNRLPDDDPWSTGHTRRRWIPHIPDSPEGFAALGPRRVPTAVIAGIPVPDRTSSQHVADQLAALLNARPARMAGAVWAVFRHELHPRSHMGEVLAQITDPELPAGWRHCYAEALAWTPGTPPTDWTPAPVGIVQRAVRCLDAVWPCPGFPPGAHPLNAEGFMIANPDVRFAGAAPPPGFQPFP